MIPTARPGFILAERGAGLNRVRRLFKVEANAVKFAGPDGDVWFPLSSGGWTQDRDLSVRSGGTRVRGEEGMRNPCGKMRKIEDPYAIYQSSDGWEWRVLKKNQAPDKEAKNPYASWYCAVKSPYTFGSYEYGDVCVRDIIRGGGVDVTEEVRVAESLAGQVEGAGRRGT